MIPTALNKPVGKCNSSTVSIWIQLMSYCHLVRMLSKITGNNSLESSFRNTCSIPSALTPLGILSITSRTVSIFSIVLAVLGLPDIPFLLWLVPVFRYFFTFVHTIICVGGSRSANRSLNALRSASRLPVLKCVVTSKTRPSTVNWTMFTSF